MCNPQDESFRHRVISNISGTPMTSIVIDPGACGFICKITAKGTGRYDAIVTVESECKQIKRLAQEVSSVDFMEIVKGRFGENAIFHAASRCGLHSSCLIPSSLIKAVEAELGMAVKKHVSITFEE
jgi:hypothetical protein